MKKKIYLIQPSYRNNEGEILKGKKLYVASLSLPAVSSLIPGDWEKEICYEYFDEIDFDTDASVIGLSSMGYEIFRAVEIADEFRKRGKIVLAGGFQPHISSHFIADHCDSIIHGNPGLAAMKQILTDIENNSLKKEYHAGMDMNYRIDYSGFDHSKVFFTPVLFSIGCCNNCDYCIVGSIYQGNYRLRNIEHVKQELEYLSTFTKRIAVVDTNFYCNRDFLVRICSYMIERKLNFVWGAQCTIDIGGDKEVLELLSKAGCTVLFIGLESISQENLDAVHKNYSTAEYAERIRNIQKAGIKIAGFFIYGFDGDTIKTGKQMADFIKKTRIALPMLNVLVPTPGTKIFEKLKSEDRVLMDDEQFFLKNNPAYNSSFNLCFYKPKNMTPDEIENGFIDLLRRLSGIYQVIRRSLSKQFILTLFLLYQNWLFRKEYFVLKKRRKERLKEKNNITAGQLSLRRQE